MPENKSVSIRDRRFLVTGAAGFVGMHLVRALIEQGASEVIALDQHKKNELDSSLWKNPVIKYTQCDIADLSVNQELFKGVDGIFHMAVLPLGACNQDPALAVRVNVLGAFNVFKAAREAGVKKVVYSSASSVYGDTLDIMDESHPLNAQTQYGVSKLCAEFLLRPFAPEMSYIVLRYMNVYGPGQKGGLIPAVINKIRNGEAPVINGDGSASFDFVHVSDIVQCNLKAMQSNVSGEAFNVGSSEEATVKEIVDLILGFSHSDLKAQFNTQANLQMQRRVGSSEKAKRLLNYAPTLSLKEGLRNLVLEAAPV